MAKDDKQKAFENEWRRQFQAMGGRNLIPDFMALGRAAGWVGPGAARNNTEAETTGGKKDNPFIRDDRNGPGKGSNATSNTTSNTTSTTTPGSATQATPKPTAIRPKSNKWEDIVKAYFPKTGGNVYKDGGIVRGGGAAQRGRGRGKMC